MPINYIILSLMESGELTKLQNKWWHEQAKCSTANKKSHPEFYPNDGLALNNLAGIFFVLIVGLILSLFVAIIEFCFKQHDPMKQHQKFKTKPSATGTAMNTLQGKPKLTIQEQRDFDNGRVTVSMQMWCYGVVWRGATVNLHTITRCIHVLYDTAKYWMCRLFAILKF